MARWGQERNIERVCGSFSGSISPLRREETLLTEEALPVCASSLSLRVHNNKCEVCNGGTQKSAFSSLNLMSKPISFQNRLHRIQLSHLSVFVKVIVDQKV